MVDPVKGSTVEDEGVEYKNDDEEQDCAPLINQDAQRPNCVLPSWFRAICVWTLFLTLFLTRITQKPPEQGVMDFCITALRNF